MHFEGFPSGMQEAVHHVLELCWEDLLVPLQINLPLCALFRFTLSRRLLQHSELAKLLLCALPPFVRSVRLIGVVSASITPTLLSEFLPDLLTSMHVTLLDPSANEALNVV